MFGFSRLSAEGKVGVTTGVVFFSILISRTVLSDRVDIGARARLFRAQFILLINSVLLLGSLYIWKRVVTRLCGARLAAAASSRAWAHRCWRAAVLLFLALAHCSYLSMFYLVGTEPHWLALLSFTCLGAYVILIFFLMVFGCASRVLQMFNKGSVVAVSSSARQTVLALMMTALLVVYGLLNATQPPQVVEVEVPLEKLPASMDGLKLVLLSDIHLGPTVGRSQLQRVVTMVNQLEPDVVAIVGDLTDSQVTRLRTAAEPLGLLRPRLGSYFATGNHDYYTADVDNWFEFLRLKGIEPLHNSHARVFRPGQTQDWICLAGIDDLEATMLRKINQEKLSGITNPSTERELLQSPDSMDIIRDFAASEVRYPGHGMDVEKALSGCSEEHPIVLLAHQPHAAKQALQQRPDINLVLSGHTHAGQIFPLTILAFLLNPYFCGLYRVSEHTAIYVTPGTIYYGIPMRIGSRAEITQITLKSA